MHQPKNILYAQSGGATSVINITAIALLSEARKHPQWMTNLYAADGGITGVLNEKIYDLTDIPEQDLHSIANAPGAYFGTCRYKLKNADVDPSEYQRIYEIFKAHGIGYFFYNGGNDSQDTSAKIARYCAGQGLDVCCIGIPKTIDNDLMHTDTSPGFGSAAKYLAVSLSEMGADLISICGTSTKVLILEAMGRDTGWLAGSGILIKDTPTAAPHITLVPERPFVEQPFLKRVEAWVKDLGYCIIVTSEGIRDEHGDYLQASRTVIDEFGHRQLGGVGIYLAQRIKEELDYKYQLAIPSYMQRAAKHLISIADHAMAQEVGVQAVRFARQGRRSIMVTIERLSDSPFRWQVGEVPLERVANHKKPLPANFLTEDGYALTEEARAYYLPLVQGEKYPRYTNGLPTKPTLIRKRLPKKLAPFTAS